MGKIKQVKITTFSGGIATDKRISSGNKYAITKHFDALTYPKKLVPYFKTEAEEDKTLKIYRFSHNLRSGTTYCLFGLGATSADKIAVYIHDGVSWTNTTPSNNESTQTINTNGVFFYYKNFLYMWSTGNRIIRFDVDSGDVFDNQYKTIPYTNVAQPVHHPADDIAYFFNDNIVHKLDNATWDDGVGDVTTGILILPDNLKIVSATPYGNYLAIGCETLNSSDPQVIVYLWDRDSSLTTLSEQIDFGRGNLIALANLNNKLIALVKFGSFPEKTKILIKQASGQFAVILNELINDDPIYGIVVGSGSSNKQFVLNNVLFLPMSIPLNGDTRNGIWAIDDKGRATLDTVEEEVDSAVTKTYQGIFNVNGTWWIAHSNDGSVNRTDNNRTYSTTLSSVYESLIFNDNNPDLRKRLIGVTVMTEPLPTAGKIILKYQKDEDIGSATWTTIFTEDTNDSISHDAINIESTGTILPEFKEIQFQINSTGGAVVTGLKFKYELTERNAKY